MIGPNLKNIDRSTRKMIRYFIPNHFNHPPSVIRQHFPFYNIPKQTFPALYANGYKISSGLGIIVSFQTNGTTATNFRLEFHTPLSSITFSASSTHRLPRITLGRKA
jgi:hypothetical protein